MPRYITGYLISFKGRPETRRAAIRVSIDVGIESIRLREQEKPTLLIRGASYAMSSVDVIEPIRTQGELDEQRALKSGIALTEDELKTRLLKGLNGEYLPALTDGGDEI